MLLRIDMRSETPIYAQIADSIRAQIETGALEPGAQLPSARSLAVSLDSDLARSEPNKQAVVRLRFEAGADFARYERFLQERRMLDFDLTWTYVDWERVAPGAPLEVALSAETPEIVLSGTCRPFFVSWPLTLPWLSQNERWCGWSWSSLKQFSIGQRRFSTAPEADISGAQ